MARFERSKGNDRGGFQRRGSRMDSNDSRGGRDFGRDQKRFGNNRRDTVMTTVKCDSCGDTCEVPFKPTGDKPIYCSSCFKRQDSGRDSGRSSRPPAVNLDSIHEKLDKIMEALDIE